MSLSKKKNLTVLDSSSLGSSKNGFIIGWSRLDLERSIVKGQKDLFTSGQFMRIDCQDCIHTGIIQMKMQV